MTTSIRAATAGAAALLIVVVGAPSAAGQASPSPLGSVTVDSLIEPGATVEVFASGLTFSEGPLWLPDGRLLASDVPASVVSTFDAAGTANDFQRPSNHANGHGLDLDGSVIQAEHGDTMTPGRITRLSDAGEATVLADAYEQQRFNSPNDLIVKSDGSIWFTDPDFGLTGPSEIGFNGVYRLDPATGVVTLLTDALGEPNGIAFSPDERTLYVSDSNGGEVTAFPVNDDGTIGPGSSFGRGCDGIGVDELGNLWATTCASDVAVTDARGVSLGSIPFAGSTSNLAWGADDGKTLFVTSGDRIYSQRLTVGEAP